MQTHTQIHREHTLTHSHIITDMQIKHIIKKSDKKKTEKRKKKVRLRKREKERERIQLYIYIDRQIEKERRGELGQKQEREIKKHTNRQVHTHT